MADEDLAKVIFMKSICPMCGKKKTIIKQRKNVLSTSVRHIKMDCELKSVVKQSENQKNL